MLSLSIENIADKLSVFNWKFSVGNNILHNIEGVFFLYSIKNKSKSIIENNFINKQISITLVSVIEAILYDFIVRLSEATNHFPQIIDESKRQSIKKYLAKQKVIYTPASLKNVTYSKVKNYSLLEIIQIIQRFELLGVKTNPIYKTLVAATYFRNRIHICNWWENFEINEAHVFTDKRLLVLEKTFTYILDVMSQEYSRKWK